MADEAISLWDVDAIGRVMGRLPDDEAMDTPEQADIRKALMPLLMAAQLLPTALAGLTQAQGLLTQLAPPATS